MSLSEKTQILQNYIKNNQNISDISQSEISKIYQDLIDCITDHNHLYYIESAPIISDYEYDKLFDYLKKIEQYFPYMISGNSPTQKLVNQIQDGFEKYDRENGKEMLSLENTYNSENLKDWGTRIIKILEKEGINEKLIYQVEPKFDGISIELWYKDGVFSKAVTRGDGKTGEIVSENVKKINKEYIPNRLKGIGESTALMSFRGEIIIPKSKLIEINKEREKQGLNTYSNTRNLASGSLKQLNTNITKERGLQCYVYDKESGGISGAMATGGDMETLEKILDTPIEEFGFKNIHLKEFNNIEDVINYCTENNRKKQLIEKHSDIDFDGLVIKIKDKWIGEKRLREIIGSTNHHPRWAVAYKFPAEQVSTRIKSVEFQVGRTGIITPVANLEPVNLSGATISRVSLHNFDFIKEKDIHHNDFVRLQRSGEVIPYIVGVIKERRDTDALGIILPPTQCPSCGTTLTPVDMHYYCQNPDCPAQIKEKIIRFVSKDCMDIEGIGESIVEILVDHNIIKNIADLYKLLDFETERIVRRFPGFADKKITEIQKQLQESKNKEFRRLLNGLGIPGIGKKTAKDISNVISTETTGNEEISSKHLEQISQYLTNKEFLISIYGVGEKIVEGIINYRNTNSELLKKLEQLGLNFSTDLQILNSKFGILNSFSITGSFDIPRPKIIEEMEKNGYTFDQNPTKNTKYMLIGSKPGSKLAKSEELGTEIINSRENITKKFPFLLEIKPEKTKNNGPEQIGLF